MDVLRDQKTCPRPAQGTVVTIGAYDGVHLGHQAVIAEVRRRAEARGLASAVVTFDRHPASVVRPDSAPRLLTDLDQKLELLAATGLDYCLVITFDEARSHETAEDFVHEVLADCLHARLVVVGEDFHFGHGRAGDVALLTKLGRELDFAVEGIELVDATGQPASDDSAKVSSTRIRHALVGGDLATANELLGRPYEVRGVVATGTGEAGSRLGFPTADVAVPVEVLVPADGIYAGWYQRPDGSVHPAALYLGRNPMLALEPPANVVEAHLLDFSGDLYDEAAAVRFVRRLRGDERFDSVDALIAQIGRDVAEARLVLEQQR
jgi:riboflavin kinase / FMN adenylyltransferase